MKDLAEKVLLGIINAGYCGEPNELAKQAYDIAAAMQDEADKRDKEKQDKAKQEQQNYEDALDSIGVEQWQPDWSQAPSHMNYYFMNRDGGEYWTVNKPDEPNLTEHVVDCRACGGDCYAYASSQNYQGNWQGSLRKRPQ